MIKVDVISGFLGAGKTTLIKHLISALYAQGERVVVIENEFGEIGIDGAALELDGLKVYEIAQGCICCTLKEDFIYTVIRVADQIKPDRILIEPSGIFVLSEMFEIFKHEDLRGRLEVNSVLTVVDVLNYMRQHKRYGYYFENQVRYADSIVISKTEEAPEDAIMRIMNEVHLINPGVSVHAEPWSRFEPQDFLDLLDVSPAARQASKPRRTVLHPHIRFSSFGFRPEREYSIVEMQVLLEKLADESVYGKVLRAKGFADGRDGAKIEFHYSDGQTDIGIRTEPVESAVSIIGEKLNREAIMTLFG